MEIAVSNSEKQYTFLEELHPRFPELESVQSNLNNKDFTANSIYLEFIKIIGKFELQT